MKGLVINRYVLDAYGRNWGDALGALTTIGFDAFEISGPSGLPMEIIEKFRQANHLEISADSGWSSNSIAEETFHDMAQRLRKEAEVCRRYGIQEMTVNAQILEKEVMKTMDKASAKHTDEQVITFQQRVLRELEAQHRELLRPENSSYYPTGPRTAEQMRALGLPITLDVSHAVLNDLPVDSFEDQVGKVQYSDNLSRFEEAELLVSRKYPGAETELAKFKHPWAKYRKRDFHLPAGTGCFIEEEHDYVRRLAARGVPVFHELKSTGLGILGPDWDMKKAIEYVAAQA